MSLFVQSASQASVVTSGRTRIDFNDAKLVGISDHDSGYSFLNGTSPEQCLWTVELRKPNGDEKTAVVIDEPKAALTSIRGGGKRLVLTWSGIAVGNEKNALDVIVTIQSQKDSMTDWRIRVDNRSKELGVWLVKFPRIVGLSVGKTGQAAVPFGMGQVYDDPVHDTSFAFDDTYPGCLYSMQFASLSDNGSCLYLATHDPEAYIKKMRFAHTSDASHIIYEITQLPPNMGVPGHNYVQPYPCIVGAIPGDWVNAAKFYRKWVLANSEWMKGKQPLAKRTDMPDWMKRLPYWIGFHEMTDENMAAIEKNIKSVGVPAAVHMYHWHQIPFDTHYPDFWPPRDQIFNYVKRLHALNAKVMPYTNMHLMDEQSVLWNKDEAWKYVVQPADGKEIVEVWSSGTGVKLRPMCPATQYWQNMFDDLTVKLVRDLDCDAIYCDQVACISAMPCFNPNHSHPVGGGCYWVSGYRKLLENVRKSAASVKKDVFLTTESAAEPYDFDMYLRCNEGAPFLTPIWQMVYSGYRLSFGFYFYEDREWIAKLATQYLWGVQIGWSITTGDEKSPEISRFKRECARARYAASDYLALGEMLRSPKLTGDFARYKTTWRNFGTELPIDWPAVQGSLWKAPDGSIGLALVNLHSQPQTVTFDISRADAGIGNGAVKLTSLYPVGICPDAIISGKSLKHTITLPAQSAAMLVMRSAK